MLRPVKKLLFIFCVTFIFSGKVIAVTPIPTPFFNVSIPGTCGYATSSDPNIVKCCKTPISSPDALSTQFKNNIPAIAQPITAVMIPFINKQAAVINFIQTETLVIPCVEGSPSTPGDANSPSCICIAEPTGTPLSSIKPVCASMSSNTNEKSQCEACADNGGYWSSLGCFSGNVSEFISQKILGTGVGLAGGISLLCIMFAAFQMQTSGGNAEKIKKAQELLTNCITGLMVIIFSVLILKIIGVDILRLPNFGL